MSHSYFTRFLGLVIVAVVCVPLFLTGSLALMIAYQLVMALPLLGAFFMWSATRAAPVFDDEAFHRTLPPRDGAVFLRLLRLPLGVAGGIVLVVLGYGIYCGFGWRTLLFGSVFLAAPVVCVLAGCGTAAAAATGRNERNGLRVLAWAAVLATPVISILLLGLILSERQLKSLIWVVWPYYGPRVLLAALLYLPAWWLVAARRKRAWGVGLAAVTGLALPWLWVQDVTRQGLEEFAVFAQSDSGVKTGVQVTRKALPVLADAATGYPLDQVFEVKGLAQDELLVTGQVSVGAWPKLQKNGTDPDDWYEWDRTEHLIFRAKRPHQGYGISMEDSYSLDVARADDGSGMRWGRQAVFEILRRGLPAGVTLKNWEESHEDSAPVTLDGQTGLDAAEPSKPWLMQGSLLKFGKPVIFDAAKGGRVRLEGGGWLQMNATNGGTLLNLWQVRGDRTYPAGDPWFHLFQQTVGQNEGPYVVLVNEAKNEAFFVDEVVDRWSGPVNGRGGYLGITRYLSIDGQSMNPGPSEEMTRRYRLLPQCKVYVFWPQSIRLPKWTLEAGK